MALAQIIDHAARAVARVATQFRESGLLKGMLTAFGNEMQAVEDGLWSVVATYRSPSVAEGAVLDRIGALIGAPVRGAKTDVQYRNRIAAQILANRSNGEFSAIYAIAKVMVATWNVAGQPKIIEYQPAQYVIGSDPLFGSTALRNLDSEAVELAGLLAEASSAGVRAIVFSRPDTVTNTNFFRMSGGAGPAAGFNVGKFKNAYDR